MTVPDSMGVPNCFYMGVPNCPTPDSTMGVPNCSYMGVPNCPTGHGCPQKSMGVPKGVGVFGGLRELAIDVQSYGVGGWVADPGGAFEVSGGCDS